MNVKSEEISLRFFCGTKRLKSFHRRLRVLLYRKISLFAFSQDRDTFEMAGLWEEIEWLDFF